MDYCREDIAIAYPDEDEMIAAQKLCCGRCCTVCESPAEYAMRKREVDMSLLLEQAIENELSEKEKLVIKDKWYDSLSVAEIASVRGVATSAVSVTLKRAQEKLYHILSYVVKYQQGLTDESVVPLFIDRARMISLARNSSGESVAQRIRNLRLSQNLSRAALEKSSVVTVGRLAAIESGKSDPDIRELAALCSFFGVTADYIIKGEKYDRE